MSDDRLHLCPRLKVQGCANGFIVIPELFSDGHSFDSGSVHVARDAEQLAAIITAWSAHWGPNFAKEPS